MKNWERFELKLAKKFSGTRIRGSGCGAQKGDIRSEKYLIEAKETSKDSYTLDIQKLLKLTREAFRAQRIPVFCIQFGDNTEIALIESENCGDTFVNKSITIKTDMIGKHLYLTNNTVWSILRLEDLDV